MTKWLRRIRAAVGVGLTWSVLWVLGGLVIGIASKLLPGLPWGWFFDVFDAPLPALAMPGFVGGVLFSVVLGVAGRRRRFRDLSVPRFAAWGAVGGFLLTLFPFALAAVGLATLDGNPMRLFVAISGPVTLLSAASAAASLLLARRAERGARAEPDDDPVEVGRSPRAASELLGAGESSLSLPVREAQGRVRPDAAHGPGQA